jgi:putative transport protein
MTSSVTALLVEQPLLLLFVVAALGYPLGRVRLGGSSLGIAAVLFVGLAFGALDPRIELPEFTYLFGLVLFVYTVGLTSGAGLPSALRGRGLRELALVAGVLLGATLLTALLARALALSPASAAGLFAGSLTNTPALAAVVEHSRHLPDTAAAGTAAAEPVIAYSLTYPIGVIGTIAALALTRRLWGLTEQSERARLASAGLVREEPVTRSVRITRDGEHRLEALRQRQHWQIVFGRIWRNGQAHVVDAATAAQRGDIITVVGAPAEIARVTTLLGEESPDSIEMDRRALDYRRVFVSSHEVAGRRLGDLDLAERFGAVVTRVRRGDVEMLARDDTVLELGDRVRVVTSRENLERVSVFFGDSYRALSEIDILAFSVGPALGLLLGLVSLPLPGGVELSLGVAGGPLVIALLLGFLGRTGPVVWSLPYSANLTLRQFGLVLFLGAIGTRAGWEFRTLLATGGGAGMIAAGALVTCSAAAAAIWFGYRVLGLPFALVGGLLAAIQTQPAVLGFAVEQSHSDFPGVAYARSYPMALILKILLAQVLLEWLAR